MAEKRTLLQKYEIPLSHLDFGYIENCNNAREMEKIVQILRSGEEGTYPDLTRCAEAKLRVLKPNSKLFRLEEAIQTHNVNVMNNDMEAIYQWTSDARIRDLQISEINDWPSEYEYIPIRKSAYIMDCQPIMESEATTSRAGMNMSSIPNRCYVTDYRKWDKYDPDEEVLRMDLNEERVKENVERMNRRNSLKSIIPPKDIRTPIEYGRTKELIDSMSNIERERLSEDYRFRGNEFFRVNEYESALKEYTIAIQLSPNTSLHSYNNRSVALIKLKKYDDAIEDCKKVLDMDPTNFKAMHRMAEAKTQLGQFFEAMAIYEQMLEIYHDHAVPMMALAKLRAQLGDIPPPNATRLQISEDLPYESKAKMKKTIDYRNNPSIVYDFSKPPPIPPPVPKRVNKYFKNITQTPPQIQPQPQSQTQPPKLPPKPKPKEPTLQIQTTDIDPAELIKPKNVVKSCLIEKLDNISKTAATVGDNNVNVNEAPVQNPEIPDLLLPIQNTSSSNSKKLIEEV